MFQFAGLAVATGLFLLIWLVVWLNPSAPVPASTPASKSLHSVLRRGFLEFPERLKLPAQKSRKISLDLLFEGLDGAAAEKLLCALDKAPVRGNGNTLRLEHHAILPAAFEVDHQTAGSRRAGDDFLKRA